MYCSTLLFLFSHSQSGFIFVAAGLQERRIMAETREFYSGNCVLRSSEMIAVAENECNATYSTCLATAISPLILVRD
jgi:hypothetical protein